jgi:hypothetical protein
LIELKPGDETELRGQIEAIEDDGRTILFTDGYRVSTGMFFGLHTHLTRTRRLIDDVWVQVWPVVTVGTVYAVSLKYTHCSDDRHVLGVFTSQELAEECKRVNGIGDDGEDYSSLFTVSEWDVDHTKIRHETVYLVVPDAVRDTVRGCVVFVSESKAKADLWLENYRGEFADCGETTYRVSGMTLDSSRKCGITGVNQ